MKPKKTGYICKAFSAVAKTTQTLPTFNVFLPSILINNFINKYNTFKHHKELWWKLWDICQCGSSNAHSAITWMTSAMMGEGHHLSLVIRLYIIHLWHAPLGVRSVKRDWLIEQCLTSPPTQYRLSGRQFYRSKDPTSSIKVLKEKTLQKETPENANNTKYSNTIETHTQSPSLQ